MSGHSIFCTVMTGGKSCNRLAIFHCAGCGRALCTRHALQLRLVSGNSWVCADCRRRKLTDPKRRFAIPRW